MAPEVDPPEEQAVEALRQAMRAILNESSRWAREQHGVDTSALDAAIADLEAQTGGFRHEPLVDADSWSLAPGECTACGMDDRPVKGPPHAELCKFCDELRILPPPPEPAPVKPGWPVTVLAGLRYMARCIRPSPAWAFWAVGYVLLLSGKILPAMGCFAVTLLLMVARRP